MIYLILGHLIIKVHKTKILITWTVLVALTLQDKTNKSKLVSVLERKNLQKTIQMDKVGQMWICLAKKFKRNSFHLTLQLHLYLKF